MQKIWIDNFIVRTYEANLFQELDIVNLLDRLQDAASRHAETLGFGWDSMQDKKQFWVLSRFLVKISTIPKWKTKLKLETWPKNADGIAAYRDFIISDDEGKELIKATSMWLVLDAKTHRPVRMSNVLDNLEHTTNRVAIEQKPGKIVSGSTKQFLMKSEILYSDLDMNMHANNVSYVRKIIDSYPLEFLSKHRPEEIEINFLKEATFGQELNCFLHSKMEDKTHILSLEDENETHFLTIRFVWRAVE